MTYPLPSPGNGTAVEPKLHTCTQCGAKYARYINGLCEKCDSEFDELHTDDFDDICPACGQQLTNFNSWKCNHCGAELEERNGFLFHKEELK